MWYHRTHDQFDSISECRVHQSSQGLTQLDRKLLRCKAQQSRQWHDCEEVDNEDCSRVQVHGAHNNTGWDCDEEHIDIVARQSQPRQAHKVARQPHIPPLVLRQRRSFAVVRRARGVAQSARVSHQRCALICVSSCRMSIGFIVARHRVGEGGGGAPNGSFDAACRSRITSSADGVGCTAEGRAFDEQ